MIKETIRLDKRTLPIASLSISIVGWLIIVSSLEAVAVSAKFAYAIYSPLIAISTWIFLRIGLVIQDWAKGGIYLVLSVLWLFAGWIPAYFFAIVLTSTLIAFVGSNPSLAFVPIGLPIADICAVSVGLASLFFVATIVFNVVAKTSKGNRAMPR